MSATEGQAPADVVALIAEVRDLLASLDLDSSKTTAPGTAWGATLREALAKAGEAIDALERASQPVTEEWEYGVRDKGASEPFTDHYESFEDMSDEFDGRVVWGDDEQIVRRRKAGPWEPVEAAREAG